MLDLRNMIKIGEKPGGTVPGAMYRCNNNHVWMVKFPQTNLHAMNEVLAGKLYSAANVKVPQLELIKTGKDTLGVASRWEDKLERCHLDSKLNGLLEGFVIDAWLANWDVVGLEYDNILRNQDNEAVRVDCGGALLFRAQGAPKIDALGVVVTEVLTLMSPRVNYQSANAFRELSTKFLDIGCMKLEGVTEEKIRDLVEEVGFESPIADLMIARRSFLLAGAHRNQRSDAIN